MLRTVGAGGWGDKGSFGGSFRAQKSTVAGTVLEKGTTAVGNRCSVGAQGRNEQMYSQRPDLTAMVKPLLAGTSKNVPAP